MRDSNYVVKMYEGVKFTARINKRMKGVTAMDANNNYRYFPNKEWSKLPLADNS